MKVNGFTKIIIGVGMFAAVILAIKSGSTVDSDDSGAPPIPQTTGVGSADSEKATVSTLILRDKQRKDEVSALKDEISKLRTTLETAGYEVNPELQEQVDANKELQIETKNQLDKLASHVNDALDTIKKTANESEDYQFISGTKKQSKNPLEEGAFEITGVTNEQVNWTYPLDQPVPEEQGEFKAKAWAKDESETDSSVADSVVELNPIPVYTIPENTTLIGAQLASRIVAQIPRGGTVSNPMGFKLVVPKTIMAANGFDIPELVEANLGGYAVGNFGLRCAKGYITSMTFIFEDGRIAQVGTNLTQSGEDSVGADTLAVLTDTAGTECVAGELKTNAPAFISTKVALGAAAGAAGAYAGAQQTTQQGSDSSSSTVTGSMGKYIAGEAGVAGVNQASAYIDEMWANSFDAILVDIATNVNVEVKKQIEINYDPSARKVRHDHNEFLPEQSQMESYWQ